ncbi:MAG: ABC transporter permease [Sphingobacteriaceae bacterium]
MLKNYLKSAWRNMCRNKLYSAINIGGLALGLAICMLITLYVIHEYSFDRFHAHSRQIFSVSQTMEVNGQTINSIYMPYHMAPEVVKNDDQAVTYLRLQKPFISTLVISNTDKGIKFAEKKVLYADANFFRFFSFGLLQGQANKVLSDPFSVVISEKMKEKYFGDENPVGKNLLIKTDSSYLFQVSGVMKNLPSNTDIEADFIVSMDGMRAMKENENRNGPDYKVYFLLKNASSATHVQKTIQNYGKQISPGFPSKYNLTPLIEEHLGQGYSSTAKYLKIFPFVALLILLMALVNYMSLSTARATLRAKEIGIRKVSGADRKTIAAQFYVESAMYTLLAFALGYFMYFFGYSYFLNILQIQIDHAFISNSQILLVMAGLFLFTMLIAGSYPSLVLSAFKPIATLQGKMSKQTGGSLVRKVFTTLQFSIAVVLLICGAVIYNQLSFLRHLDTGVDRENVISIPINTTMGNHYQAFKKDIQNLAGVKEVGAARYELYKGFDMFSTFGDDKTQNITLKMLTVDQHFIPLMGIKWKIAPPSLDAGYLKNKIIVNEALLKQLNLKGNPIGQKIGAKSNDMVEIVGVVKDFNFQSLNAKIDGLGIFIGPDDIPYWTLHGSTVLLKINAKTNLTTLIAALKKKYSSFDQESAFEYQFADDSFNAMFKAEDRLADLFSLFMGLTLLIAIMGLIGLATFNTAQRRREIGIRKVIGASVNQITSLLAKDFLRLVLLAILIAFPIAWYGMHQWLQNFNYRVTISWWIFIGVGVLTMLAAILSVSFQAIKAAVANPVKSLRSE